MRPIRLEVEGFTAFRERTAVDFDGTDLFVLWGATGSGKSSIIDAMIFALYGSVPRYDDTRLVEPVITQGRQEAKVRLDFELAGRRYTAARVVRRQKSGGATTKEARLEQGDSVLAGNLRDLNEAVQRLLGLDFDQFTTCVVLPQGDFARFLHARPKERQELLKKLLRIDLYQRIREAARRRRNEKENALSNVEGRLAELADATEASAKALRGRVQALERLGETVRAGQRQLEEQQQALKEREQAAGEAAREVALLETVVSPPELAALTGRIASAKQAVSEARAAREAAEAGHAQAEAARDGLGEEAPLHAWLARRRQLADVCERIEARLADAEAAEARARDAADVQQAADAALTAAEGRERALARSHQAWHLAQGLGAGEPCPVCFRALDEAPVHEAPADGAAVAGAVREAEAAAAEARRRATAAQGNAVAIRNEVASLQAQRAALEAELAEVPSASQIGASLEAIRAADAALRAARQTAAAATKAERDAAAKLEAVLREEKSAWGQYDAKRDALAALEPPVPAREQLQASWAALEGWAHEVMAAKRARQRELEQAIHALQGETASIRARLDAACKAEDVHPDGSEPLVEAVTHALARERAALEHLQADINKRREYLAERRVLKQAMDTANTLARHLHSNAFEGWLLQEAFHQLIGGASERLYSLSSGDYSFAWDEKDHFAIVDHRNADEQRPPRTLSGGETFLASLSLALALAEQVAGLAEDGAARLESMFLDEGFGTLDADTLDTVASVIEDLGAQGRCIGIITHVRELAERIPVQYRVRRDAVTARVERVLT